MSSVRVVARLVDGGGTDWVFGEEFLAKLTALEAQGLTGKALINMLISDDWGAPPLVVTISWEGPDGGRIVRAIEYD